MRRGVEPVDDFDEKSLRSAAFDWLGRFTASCGGAVRRDEMSGFEWRGRRVRLMASQQGIWKPQGLRSALSITSVEGSPYNDDFGEDGLLRYKWRRGGRGQPDNVALRNAMIHRDPLIWFRHIGKSMYLPIFPVWVVGEEPESQQVLVSLEDVGVPEAYSEPSSPADLVLADPGVTTAQRSYRRQLIRQRAHQPAFRAQVLYAYRRLCALCRLRRPELLDAAHIRPDSRGGEPHVSNGIAMCKLHHAAFDESLLAITPDYAVEIRSDVLEEEDGPTLTFALQGLHRSKIVVPDEAAKRPSRELPEERYELFRKAS